jgi:NADP-dependent 3-hydroxy acid dehydrogenase YdfG
MSEIESKVVIITGASSGVGEATARRLGASGAKLMLAARREDRLKDLVAAIEKTGGTVAYRVTDVADRAQVQALADATLETYGRIDVLVNNAALMPVSPLDQIKVDEWDQIIDVNLKGVLYGIAAVLPTMRQQKSGHVINLSSIGGHKVFPGRQFTVLPSMQCEQFPKGCDWSQTVKFVLPSFHPVRLRLKGCCGSQTVKFVLPTFHPVRLRLS